jgi:hypothetical protein
MTWSSSSRVHPGEGNDGGGGALIHRNDGTPGKVHRHHQSNMVFLATSVGQSTRGPRDQQSHATTARVAMRHCVYTLLEKVPSQGCRAGVLYACFPQSEGFLGRMSKISRHESAGRWWRDNGEDVGVNFICGVGRKVRS